MKLAALASQVVNGQTHLRVVARGSVQTDVIASIWLEGYMLRDLAANPNCKTPFLVSDWVAKPPE